MYGHLIKGDMCDIIEETKKSLGTSWRNIDAVEEVIK